MRTREPHTLVGRVQDFLNDAHAGVQKDKQFRMAYCAMGYHLSGMPIAAMQRLGIVRRYGWNWQWTGRAPDKAMAIKVADVGRSIQREYYVPIKRRNP